MVTKSAGGGVSTSIEFGGGTIKVDISKGDLAKIKDYVKGHRYTNKTVLRLDCGFKNPVRMVLQVHNSNAEATGRNGGDENVV